MKLLMNLAQAIPGDMSVNLSRADVGVAEQFLDHAQVGAVFEQMGGEAVPQHMRRDIAFDAGTARPLLDAFP
jgi:hypothetical protein